MRAFCDALDPGGRPVRKPRLRAMIQTDPQTGKGASTALAENTT